MGSFRFFLHTPDSALYPNKLTNKLQKNPLNFIVIVSKIRVLGQKKTRGGTPPPQPV